MHRKQKRHLSFEPLETRQLLAGDLTAVSFESGNLNIELNLGPGIVGNTAAISAFQRAADFWESVIRDPVDVYIDVDIDDPQPGIENALAFASSSFASYFYPDIRQRLINDAAADESIVAQLPTPEALEFLTPDGIQVRDPLGTSPVIRLTTANAKALGFTDPNVPASQFVAGEVADALISFSSDVNYDFDSSNGISRGAFDFEGVALHEIGHALGKVSSVDTVDTLLANGAGGNVDPSLPDLFRLAPGQGSQFSTAPRFLTTGPGLELQVFHDGQFDVSGFAGVIPQLQTGDIPLSSGIEFGDGQQASHFKDDVRSGQFIGILDPTIGQGTVATVAPTDLRVLGLIGWDLDPQIFDTTATASLTTSGELTGAEINGTVTETDSRVFVRVPEVHGTNSVSVTGRVTGATGSFVVSNSAFSESDIEAVQIILPGVGGGSGATVASPFFDPTNGFSVSQTAGSVGLVSPQSGDIFGFSKSTELLFTDFDPGDSLEFSIDIGLNPTVGTLSGTQVIVDFANGVRETGELLQNGGTISTTIVSDHYEEAIVRSDGTFSLEDDRFAGIPAGNFSVQGVAVDRNGTFTEFDGEFFRAAPWQNPINNVDVDGNSVISPLDALLVINRLGSGLPLTVPIDGNAATPPFLDVDGNNLISPIDALTVINALNSTSSSNAVQRSVLSSFDFANNEDEHDEAFRDETDFWSIFE